MNTGAKFIVLGSILLTLSAVPSRGQAQGDASENSLGNIARKLNAQKAKDPKPVRIITNDNLLGVETDVSVVGTVAKDAKTAEPTARPAETKPPAHNEAYFRSEMSTLTGKLENNQRELDVLNQKLGQNKMQYYDDPNKSLQQQYSRADVDKLKSEIDAKQKEVAADQKAIDDLRDQLRHEGGDAGWLR